MNEPRPPSQSQGLPPAQPQGQPAQRPGGIPQRPPAAGAPQAPRPQAAQQPRAVPFIPGRPAPTDDEPIALDGDDEPIALEEASTPVAPAPPRLPTAGPSGGAPAPATGIGGPSKIKFYAGGDKHTYNKFKREPHSSIMGATRVRSFHGRLSDDGLAYTDDKINEWLDNHPEVEIKHVNCLVGPLEGKVTGEQGLIVVIWY